MTVAGLATGAFAGGFVIAHAATSPSPSDSSSSSSGSGTGNVIHGGPGGAGRPTD